MSYILSGINQIRFPVETVAFGELQIVINRPGVLDLDIAAADTLLLSRVTDEVNGDYSPFLVDSSVPISKKFTTTAGRQALDDLTIRLRDSYGYSGHTSPYTTPIAVAERFKDGSSTGGAQTPVPLTFFDVWFDSASKYKAFVRYADRKTGFEEVAFEGLIDPAYRPSSEPNITNPGTANQIWLGTQTIQIVSLVKTAFTWRDCLTHVSSSDCQDGTPVNGFMLAPPGCDGKSNTRGDAFSSSPGGWYLAVPHFHLFAPGDDPILTLVNGTQDLRVMKWPSTPWRPPVVGQIVPQSDGTLGAAAGLGGVGYALGDTGTIDGGATLATYTVSLMGGGHVLEVTLGDPGSGYATSLSATTTPGGSQPGIGTGLSVIITKVGTGAGWGPSGFTFITVGKLFAKAALTMNLGTFNPATDLKSALDFFAQKSLNSGGQRCFPVDPTPIPIDEIYVSLNVLAKSHPFDGSYWDIPAGYSQETPLLDVLAGIANSILADFNAEFAPVSGPIPGDATLVTTAMGTPLGTVPTNWVNQGSPAQEETATSPRSATVNNRGDDLKIQCPEGAVGDSTTIETSTRLHRIGQTSGFNPVQDLECVTWDASKKLEEQADECFKVAWIDQFGNATVNANCWKGLCYFYWFHAANSSPVYPSNWSPFTGSSWANHFYVLNACYRSGDIPSANLQAEIQGNDYFNTRDYHAVAFAALTLTEEATPQTFEYSGVSDNTGSVAAIKAGLAGNWRLRQNSTQGWRGIEITQELYQGVTTVKFTPVGSGASRFPHITDLLYGPVGGSGGTSSTTGGNTQTGGVTIPPSSVSWHPIGTVSVTGTGIQSLSGYDLLFDCADNATTGVTLPTVAEPMTCVVVNSTVNDFAAGDVFIPSKSSWLLMFANNSIQYDPTLPLGWIAWRTQ